MPDISFPLKVLGVLFQYGILFFIYYFVYQIVKLIYHDLRVGKTEKKHADLKEAILTIVETNDNNMMNRRFAFTKEISIGRGCENDIVVDDTYVSYHHAIICLVNNFYVIEDLNSVNHIYINGQLLKKKKYLQNGDLIKIGLVTLRFER